MRKKLQQVTANLTAEKAVSKARAWSTQILAIRPAQDSREDLRHTLV